MCEVMDPVTFTSGRAISSPPPRLPSALAAGCIAPPLFHTASVFFCMIAVDRPLSSRSLVFRPSRMHLTYFHHTSSPHTRTHLAFDNSVTQTRLLAHCRPSLVHELRSHGCMRLDTNFPPRQPHRRTSRTDTRQPHLCTECAHLFASLLPFSDVDASSLLSPSITLYIYI